MIVLEYILLVGVIVCEEDGGDAPTVVLPSASKRIEMSRVSDGGIDQERCAAMSDGV